MVSELGYGIDQQAGKKPRTKIAETTDDSQKIKT